VVRLLGHRIGDNSVDSIAASNNAKPAKTPIKVAGKRRMNAAGVAEINCGIACTLKTAACGSSV